MVRCFLGPIPLGLVLFLSASPVLAQSDGRPRMEPTIADFAYGDHERHVLDFYRAESAVPTPLVLYIHGGGFTGGDKRSVNQGTLQRLLSAGISVSAINYRLAGQVPLPAAHQDVRKALLQPLRSMADESSFDKDRGGASGRSGTVARCQAFPSGGCWSSRHWLPRIPVQQDRIPPLGSPDNFREALESRLVPRGVVLLRDRHAAVPEQRRDVLNGYVGLQQLDSRSVRQPVGAKVLHPGCVGYLVEPAAPVLRRRLWLRVPGLEVVPAAGFGDHLQRVQHIARQRNGDQRAGLGTAQDHVAVRLDRAASQHDRVADRHPGIPHQQQQGSLLRLVGGGLQKRDHLVHVHRNGRGGVALRWCQAPCWRFLDPSLVLSVRDEGLQQGQPLRVCARLPVLGLAPAAQEGAVNASDGRDPLCLRGLDKPGQQRAGVRRGALG